MDRTSASVIEWSPAGKIGFALLASLQNEGRKGGRTEAMGRARDEEPCSAKRAGRRGDVRVDYGY